MQIDFCRILPKNILPKNSSPKNSAQKIPPKKFHQKKSSKKNFSQKIPPKKFCQKNPPENSKEIQKNSPPINQKKNDYKYRTQRSKSFSNLFFQIFVTFSEYSVQLFDLDMNFRMELLILDHCACPIRIVASSHDVGLADKRLHQTNARILFPCKVKE